MTNIAQNTENTPLSLAQRMHAWRTTPDNPTGEPMTLHQARGLLGISIGGISGAENGKAMTMGIFRAYHKADPQRFPAELSSELV